MTGKGRAWGNSRRRQELPGDWADRRVAVFERDGYRCRRCGAPATEVDHFGAPGDHRLEVLQSVCHPCHVRLTVARRPASRRRRPPERHPGFVEPPAGGGG